MKWLILIVLIVFFNGIALLEILPADWQLPFLVIANIFIFGWAFFAPEKKENE